MKKILVCFGFLMISLLGCQPAPSDQILESYNALADVMSIYGDKPDELLPKLDECIEKYQPVWHNIQKSGASRSADSIDREVNMRKDKLHDATLRLVDLDLRIQDNLKNDPEKLLEYNQMIQKIGRPDAEI